MCLVRDTLKTTSFRIIRILKLCRRMNTLIDTNNIKFEATFISEDYKDITPCIFNILILSHISILNCHSWHITTTIVYIVRIRRSRAQGLFYNGLIWLLKYLRDNKGTSPWSYALVALVNMRVLNALQTSTRAIFTPQLNRQLGI